MRRPAQAGTINMKFLKDQARRLAWERFAAAYTHRNELSTDAVAKLADGLVAEWDKRFAAEFENVNFAEMGKAFVESMAKGIEDTMVDLGGVAKEEPVKQ